MTDRLINLAIAAGAARVGGISFGRNELGYLTSRLSGDYFFRLAAHLQINHLVECGANEAETSVRFVEQGLGTATAIEANPQTFRERTAKAAVQGVCALNLALSNAAGEVTLKVPVIENKVFEGASSIFSRSENASYQEYQVKQNTLDSIQDELELNRYARLALWIDVEGLALEVLQGARNLLSAGKISLIYVEVESHRYWEGQHLASDVDRYLAKLSYAPVIRDIQSENQFNLIYISTEMADACDELTMAYWCDFSRIRPSLFFLLRAKAASIKQRLLRSGWSATPVHVIAALLGSKSSRTHLVKRIKG